MGNEKFRISWRSIISLFLTLVLIFAVVPVATVSAQEAGENPTFEQMLNQLRQELFNPAIPDLRPRQTVVDNRAPLHTLVVNPLPNSIPYRVGDMRYFRSRLPDPMTAFRLVEQGQHVNIWVPTQGNFFSNATVDVTAMAERLDDVYYRMTRDIAPFAGVRVYTARANMPVVGDIQGDGRVNVLWYDAGGAYFSSSHFQREINGHPNDPIAAVTLSGGNFGLTHYAIVFAHEFQHLLFYMYLNVYYRGASSRWFNDSLSELVDNYWSTEGTNAHNWSSNRMFRSSGNVDGTTGTGAVDFLNCNSGAKVRGMQRMHGLFVHRLTRGAFTQIAYDYFRETFPPARNAEEYLANRERAESHGILNIVGDIYYRAGLTGSTGAQGELAFNLLYFIFMESFGADGGNVIINGVTHPTMAFIERPYSAYNLWALRPRSVGNPTAFRRTGGILERAGNEVFPLLPSGGNVSLTGYNGTIPNGATHEKFYRLDGGGRNNPILTISVDDNSQYTLFYVAIPNDPVGAVSSANNREFGRDGATLHLLTGGNNAQNIIDTGGQTAYLFVVTLFRDISTTVTYSWGR